MSPRVENLLDPLKWSECRSDADEQGIVKVMGSDLHVVIL